MIENNPSNVSSAFEMLLEEIEAEIDFVNGIGSKAFDDRDYDKAKEALERAGVLTGFRDKVAELRKQWKDIAAVGESQEDEETKAERRNLGKLRKGTRTPEDAYQCFMRTEMDWLVIDNFVFDKKDQPKWEEKEDWKEEYNLD